MWVFLTCGLDTDSDAVRLLDWDIQAYGALQILVLNLSGREFVVHICRSTEEKKFRGKK